LRPNNVSGYRVTGNKRMDFAGILGLLAIILSLGFDGTAMCGGPPRQPTGQKEKLEWPNFGT
jgi:hypothetical protein